MIDVIEVAAERRVMLAAELAKLDSFIRMARALVKHSQGLGRDPLLDSENPAPRALPADRGIETDFIRENAKATSGMAMIPVNGHRAARTKIDGRPSALRNRLERRFNELKNTYRQGVRDEKTAARWPAPGSIASIRLRIRNIAKAIKAYLVSRSRIERRFNELKSARQLAIRDENTASLSFGFNNIGSIHFRRRRFAVSANSDLLTIGQRPDRGGVKARTVTTNKKTVTVEDSVRNASFQSNDAQDNVLAQARAALRDGVDQFTFNEETSENEDELVLIGAPSNKVSSVDVHVGKRLRQRRWMMALTQQQLGDLIGVNSEQIQKYEAGAIHISADRMWNVAEAMDVPMSHFFEGMEGQAPDSDEETAAVEEAVTVESSAQNVEFQSDAGENNVLAQASAAFRAGADHMTFNEETSVNEDELVLTDIPSDKVAPVDIHVGQRLRQRRWMMGLSQKQLGDLVGLDLEQVKRCETGAERISAGRMWDVAVAMEVPVSFFFEGLEGQAPDTGEARGDILNGEEADELVRAYCAIPEDQRQQLFDLARVLSEDAA